MNYLKDKGIYRDKNKYYYHRSKGVVSDAATLERVDNIYVPPAWKSVWYASSPRSHIQCHGIDESGKKQYILSEAHIQKSKTEKYKRMKQFMNDLSRFKRHIRLNEFVSTKEHVLHLLFWLLMETHIRVGNEMYVPESYGLTTMRQHHLKQRGETFTFDFVGKSGVIHKVPIPKRFNQHMSQLQRRTEPNTHLFWYRSNGSRKSISSDELNEYLKQHMGEKYTCKDFRTYSANVLFIKAFLKNSPQSGGSPKRFILQCIDESADQLGHSRSISRKSYISGNLLEHCTEHFETAKRSTLESLIRLC
jgi:DNA topoisomerase-1